MLTVHKPDKSYNDHIPLYLLEAGLELALDDSFCLLIDPKRPTCREAARPLKFDSTVLVDSSWSPSGGSPALLKPRAWPKRSRSPAVA